MYSFDSRVRYSECDENGRLSLVSMIDYLQDCSTFHCEDMGEGILGLKQEGLGWILANWRIEVSRLPLFGEKIRISTWCYEMKRLHAMRNFQITDEKGESLVTADSQWFLYNLNEQKVSRIPESQQFYIEDTPRAQMGQMERKLAGTGDATQASPIIVSEQHLDTNRHVNNAEYVRFALLAAGELGHAIDLVRLEVQYRTMALLGDTLTPVVYGDGNDITVSINGDDGKARAIVRMEGRA